MDELRFYDVGGHRFAIAFPKGMLSERELMPYAPFQTGFCSDQDRLFTVTVMDEAEMTSDEGPAFADLEDENGRMTIFRNVDGGLTFHLHSGSGHENGCLCISPGFHTAIARIGGADGERRYALDTMLMLLYAFASASHDTLLLHASTVEAEGKGYLFLGKSGTGKSTHSRLWIENIADTELLNDDNPVMRLTEGKAYVYGSPWSGKTPCYRRRRVPVGGMVRLKQAPFNRITPLSGIKAYAAILPSASCMKWDHGMAEAIHRTICKIIETVPVHTLECLPDKEAAILCSGSLTADTHGPCVRRQTSTMI